MTLLAVLLNAINPHKNQVLRFAQCAMTESQFRSFRGLFLDEFGENGLETELKRIVADYEKLRGKESGRPIHAGKEVPHD